MPSQLLHHGRLAEDNGLVFWRPALLCCAILTYCVSWGLGTLEISAKPNHPSESLTVVKPDQRGLLLLLLPTSSAVLLL